MTKSDLVLRKLTSLRDHLDRMRRRRPDTFALLEGDLDRQDALGMSLLVAVQDALDIALHVASDEGWGVPSSFAESFDLLARRGVLGLDVAAGMAKMAAMRNRIAHGYASVDLERLWRELPAGFTTLDAYARSIAAWLGKQPS